MDGDERGEPREVADVMGKEVLQPMRKHGGRDVGVMHLPTLDREPLNQFAKLVGDDYGVLQNMKSRSERGNVSEDGRVVRRCGLG